MSAAPVAVDLFAGAGGLAEGLLKAGINVAASVELHPQPGLTHALNHPDTGVLVGDIRELDLDTLQRVIAARTGAGAVDLVVGGPPCQGFSSAGKKAATDPRNNLFLYFAEVIAHFRPRMFLMENVPGFQRMYGGAVYEQASQVFAELGYQYESQVVVAARYGVPQRRRRFAMVGWLPGSVEPFCWPEPTHAESSSEDAQSMFADGLAPYTTVGDALADLEFLDLGFEATRYAGPATSAFAEARRNGNELVFNHLVSRHRDKAANMFARIPVGGSIRDVEPEHRTLKRTMVRLDPRAIANAVVSLPDDMIHHVHNRILGVRECARLQTFDDDFVFIGKRTSGFIERRVDCPQYTQVGNAVPPLLGEALGRALLGSFGLPSVDRRNLEVRRRRHLLVCGSSGYAGYTLAPEAKKEIELLTVRGESIPLPITDSDDPVHTQPPVWEWKAAPPSRRGQWAPGVAAKDRPNWVADD